MASTFLVGAAEIDITPPVGTPLAGSLYPRPSEGVADPLFVKALVLESGGVRLAYVVFDVAGFYGGDIAPAVAAASAATGISADHIVWSCTHTHSGPCTWPDVYPDGVPDPVDHAWMDRVRAAMPACVAEADRRKAPARMSRLRGYRSDLSHNRRLRYKDGREINTWLLQNGEDDLQCVGAAGPIDPEIGMLAFDGEDGTLRAVLFHFTLHANARGGSLLSADYPGVVAARLREAFGPQVITLYAPGACGDINPVRGYREIGDAIAETMLPKLRARTPIAGDIPLGITARTVSLPMRDFTLDQEARLQRSQWGTDVEPFFRDTQRRLAQQGRTHAEGLLHAWHIGDTSFATFPGEPFIGLGMRIKAESPFPWTYPVELCNDYLGYLITPQAWDAGGYEALLSTVGLITPEGCDQMVEENLAMLRELRG